MTGHGVHPRCNLPDVDVVNIINMGYILYCRGDLFDIDTFGNGLKKYMDRFIYKTYRPKEYHYADNDTGDRVYDKPACKVYKDACDYYRYRGKGIPYHMDKCPPYINILLPHP